MTSMTARICLAGAALALAACASVPKVPASTAPKFPDYPVPEIPAALRVTQDVRDRQALGWQRLQSGDLRGAQREFNETLKKAPGFYPAETGLGFAALADRQFKQAADRFASTLGRDNRYVPAWKGLVEAQLGLENFDEAVAALERLLALDPTREADRTRLELLRFREVQSLIEAGRRARHEGRLEEADGILTRALALSSASTVILRELASVETAGGQLDEAEAHARRAVEIDPSDAEAHAALGGVLDARGLRREAAAAYARAAALDPAWRTKALDASARADAAAVPAEIRDLGTASSVTRGEVAALIGMRLGTLVARAPKRAPQVATDIRTHWAAAWIIPVTQAGIIEVFSNHTFQPASVVRRGDLAQAVAELVALALADRADQLERWRTARPAFADVGPANAFYRAAAMSVAAGVMSADGAGRFQPTLPATGVEVLAALARIEQLAVR